MEKMQKWLMVMEDDFLETVHRNGMKLLEHVAILPIQFFVKPFFKWMHGFHVRVKTNFVLGIFASRHFAFLSHDMKNEFGL